MIREVVKHRGIIIFKCRLISRFKKAEDVPLALIGELASKITPS